MNWQTIATFIICGVCGVLCIVMLTYGLIRWLKIRKERYKRFGYHTLTNRQKLNVLKSKAKNLVRFGYIPSVFEELYNSLTIDTNVKNAKVLNKLAHKYKRIRNYYKKHVNENVSLTVFIKNKYLSMVGEKCKN